MEMRLQMDGTMHSLIDSIVPTMTNLLLLLLLLQCHLYFSFIIFEHTNI
jgi:hypothetical protein